MIILPILIGSNNSSSGYPSPNNYEINFSSVEDVTVNHNSGKRCHVVAIDNDTNEEFDIITTHINENQCTVEWDGNKSGKLVIR